MNANQKSVAQFHKDFGVIDPTQPQFPSIDEGGQDTRDYGRLIKRAELALEELLELIHDGFGMEFHYLGVNSRALQENLSKADVTWRKIGEGDLVAAADALADIEVINHGTACELGIDLQPVFEEVMRANNAKRDKDGKPIINDGIMRPDQPIGKILKPEGWQPPDIYSVLFGKMVEDGRKSVDADIMGQIVPPPETPAESSEPVSAVSTLPEKENELAVNLAQSTGSAKPAKGRNR
jgi:predicted HAD superfamily Cof-like phosphohydrolase